MYMHCPCVVALGKHLAMVSHEMTVGISSDTICDMPPWSVNAMLQQIQVADHLNVDYAVRHYYSDPNLTS